MADDARLAERIHKTLAKRTGVTEKPMLGGLCFLLRGRMCCGVERDSLVVRVGPDHYEQLHQKRHVKPMDVTGKSLRAKFR
jgi:hypothetical protein